jgi:homoserine dehydrogenase
MEFETKRIILCGLGVVGKAFVRLINDRREHIKVNYGTNVELVAAVDIGGAALTDGKPLPMEDLLSHVENRGTVESFQSYGCPGKSGIDVLSSVSADVLIETTPTNLKDGEPGRGHIMAALENGMDVVTANKGPVVLYYNEILEKAKNKSCRISMSAATAAALPTLDVGRLCLAGADILSIEGILNGTTNYILTRMKEERCTYNTALKEAQEMGIAETDPTLDVEGYDTRNKLVLITNTLMHQTFGLDDVAVKGITGVRLEDIDEASKNGTVLKLVGTTSVLDDKISLKVEPKVLDVQHPLASVNYSEKGISYMTDTMGQVTVTGGKSSPVGAAAALLKDLIHLSLLNS